MLQKDKQQVSECERRNAEEMRSERQREAKRNEPSGARLKVMN